MKKYVGILSLAIAFGNVQFVQGNMDVLMGLTGDLAGRSGCKNLSLTALKTVAYSKCRQLADRGAQRPGPRLTAGTVTCAAIDWLGRKASETEKMKTMWQNITESNMTKTVSQILPAEMTSDNVKELIKELGIGSIAIVAGLMVDISLGSINTGHLGE